MSDLNKETPSKSVAQLSRGYGLRAVSAIFVLSLVASFIIYLLARNLVIQQNVENFNDSLMTLFASNGQIATSSNLANIQRFGGRLNANPEVSQVQIYSGSNELLWTSNQRQPLVLRDTEKARQMLNDFQTNSWVWSYASQFFSDPSIGSLMQIINPSISELDTLSALIVDGGMAKYIVKTVRDYSNANRVAANIFIVTFLAMLISGFVVLFVFSRLFRKVDQVIKEDETILNNQVAKLSSLLDDNRELQRNMKSASSRAVELNERFLRRVGSDLHDGPAQSIGYALLRLNQLTSKQISEELGHEFHAVKQSLDESLEEIRGISSGLVLPELEQMSLEEAISKVIERHKLNTSTEVKESYVKLPDDLSLPIKICSYRFVQEGLNNAYKHGGADKCRFTAQMIEDVLHLSLKDNGMGFRMSSLSTDGGHLGLAGLKDRIESLGGNLSINSELGVGTALRVSVKITDN